MKGRPTVYGFNEHANIVGYAVRSRRGWVIAVRGHYQKVREKSDAVELLHEYGAVTIKEKLE